jgi:hypothetical protein
MATLEMEIVVMVIKPRILMDKLSQRIFKALLTNQTSIRTVVFPHPAFKLPTHLSSQEI